MKKLLPLLIGLSLSGFSALSQAENLMQVYQQAKESNPDLRQAAANRDAAFEKLTNHAARCCHNLGWVRTIPIPTASAIAPVWTPIITAQRWR
ncbi:Outer membrane protein tolC precursor [Edwardsiella tarda]|nr:Outer membrane protein tolC precursor [Edwardsiella tarda]